MDHFKLENLSISFGGLKAVNNVSFCVEKNSIFSIIGPNGSGKTTIFNMISGIYKPNSGRIVCDGEDLAGLTPDRIARRGVARTFQNIELFSNATVMDNLLLGRHIHMKTGVFTGAFLWGRGSKAAREEIRNREIVEGIIDFLDLNRCGISSWRASPTASESSSSWGGRWPWSRRSSSSTNLPPG
jgi:branched-chain amino acid transport system ATP-binding protein